MEALTAAEKFINSQFPDCLVAFLAGSVVRGEATETSDLDIVVVTDKIDNAYRESFYQFGWPIEAFVNTKESYRDFFNQDKERWLTLFWLTMVSGKEQESGFRKIFSSGTKSCMRKISIEKIGLAPMKNW